MNARNDTPSQTQERDGLERAQSAYTRVERVAWGIALLTFVAGDIATTVAGLHMGAVEANPAGAWLITELGVLPAMLITKSFVVGVTFAFFSHSGHSSRIALPASLGALGLLIVARNAWVLWMLW